MFSGTNPLPLLVCTTQSYHFFKSPLIFSKSIYNAKEDLFKAFDNYRTRHILEKSYSRHFLRFMLFSLYVLVLFFASFWYHIMKLNQKKWSDRSTGSETSRPFGKIWQTYRHTNRKTDSPTHSNRWVLTPQPLQFTFKTKVVFI